MWRLQHERAAKSGSLPPPDDGIEEFDNDNATKERSPNCWFCCDSDDEEGMVVVEEAERKRIAELKEAFWKERDAEDCWKVPMGRDLVAMPWLPHRSVGVLEAIRRARNKKKVALLVDNSKHRVVDTFFAYRNCQILEAKQLVLEERTGKRSRAQILEAARKKLVNALRYGQVLYVRMSTSAVRFKGTYTSPTTLPLAIFDQPSIDTLREYYSGPAGQNLYGSSHPLAGCLREADTEHGIFTARHGFEVVVSTHLQCDDFRELLERALPLDKMQPIMPIVKARPTLQGGDGCSGDGSIEAGGGGGVGGEVCFDEEFKTWTSVEEAQAAAVKLRERVEAARERRLKASAAGDDLWSSSSGGRAGGRSSGGGGGGSSSSAGEQGVDGNGDKDGHRSCTGYGSGAAAWNPSQVVVTQPQLAGIHDAEDMPPPVTRCYASTRDVEQTARAAKAMAEHHRAADNLVWSAFSQIEMGGRTHPSGR